LKVGRAAGVVGPVWAGSEPTGKACILAAG